MSSGTVVASDDIRESHKAPHNPKFALTVQATHIVDM